jgi:hypothetical protein
MITTLKCECGGVLDIDTKRSKDVPLVAKASSWNLLNGHKQNGAGYVAALCPTCHAAQEEQRRIARAIKGH